ncbi:hypothetical protein DFH06DRAFT_1121990 [Mycena polygramma]|nr:hypothetical protein DFH06DRAFT_1121990 [Mycena polygramma]
MAHLVTEKNVAGGGPRTEDAPLLRLHLRCCPASKLSAIPDATRHIRKKKNAPSLVWTPLSMADTAASFRGILARIGDAVGAYKLQQSEGIPGPGGANPGPNGDHRVILARPVLAATSTLSDFPTRCTLRNLPWFLFRPRTGYIPLNNILAAQGRPPPWPHSAEDAERTPPVPLAHTGKGVKNTAGRLLGKSWEPSRYIACRSCIFGRRGPINLSSGPGIIFPSHSSFARTLTKFSLHDMIITEDELVACLSEMCLLSELFIQDVTGDSHRPDNILMFSSLLQHLVWRPEDSCLPNLTTFAFASLFFFDDETFLHMVTSRLLARSANHGPFRIQTTGLIGYDLGAAAIAHLLELESCGDLPWSRRSMQDLRARITDVRYQQKFREIASWLIWYDDPKTTSNSPRLTRLFLVGI